MYAHIKSISLPYTIVDVGWWYQISYPKLPSGKVDCCLTMPADEIFGTGEGMVGGLRSYEVGVGWVHRGLEDLGGIWWFGDLKLGCVEVWGVGDLRSVVRDTAMLQYAGASLPLSAPPAKLLPTWFKGVGYPGERLGADLSSLDTLLSSSIPPLPLPSSCPVPRSYVVGSRGSAILSKGLTSLPPSPYLLPLFRDPIHPAETAISLVRMFTRVATFGFHMLNPA